MGKTKKPVVNSNGKIVELDKVMVCHAENIILKDVNIEISPGEFLYLIGRVGSGKSSLLKILYGEMPMREGRGFTAGYNLHSLKQKEVPFLRRRMGVVFQDFQLLTDRKVYDNLQFVLRATGWKNQVEIDHRIREVLAEVDMVHKGYKMPHQLSGGEQQRVSIARALLNKPDLIIADEPTGNLDPDTSDELMKLLHQICKDGKTVIMATHNYNIIKRFPGRTAKCENSRLIEMQQEEIDFDLLS